MTTITALKEFRKSKKLSADDAASLFGVNRATIYRWERGEIRVPDRRLGHIEEVTGIPREVLRPDIFGARR